MIWEAMNRDREKVISFSVIPDLDGAYYILMLVLTQVVLCDSSF